MLLEWVQRQHGRLSYRLTQVLTNHGCFGAFLCLIGREESPRCHHCDAEKDTAQHTLATCPAWARERNVLIAAIGRDLSLGAVETYMVGSEEEWQAMHSFCETVISQKEAAEREREASADAPMIRRRAGRRRRQYGLLHMLLICRPLTIDSGGSVGR
ncbi:hypothetical protein ABMA28_010257 [Loxostege sticticalis]|uniref:Reverse transcriptase n=1 Tax=Loxostege sticticalis TaxID=481309 RepID=A0ABD0SA78_LOXSC